MGRLAIDSGVDENVTPIVDGDFSQRDACAFMALFKEVIGSRPRHHVNPSTRLWRPPKGET